MLIRRRTPADDRHTLPCDECSRRWTVHATVGNHLLLLCDRHAAALSTGVEEAVAAKLDDPTTIPRRRRVNESAPTTARLVVSPMGDAAQLAVERQQIEDFLAEERLDERLEDDGHG